MGRTGVSGFAQLLRVSSASDDGGMKNVESRRNVHVLLVEDSLPIRQRIRSLIEESGHGTVVGEAGSVEGSAGESGIHRKDDRGGWPELRASDATYR